jgi:hypothetical protein
VGVNYFETQRKRGDGVHFDRLVEYLRPAGNITYDPAMPVFFLPGHVFNNYLQRESSYMGAQAS